MYVIRDRKSKAVLHMGHSAPGQDLAPEAVYPEFEPETMEFGTSEGLAIPAWFTIENGVVKPADPPVERKKADRDAPKATSPSFEEVKASAIAYFSERSMQLRRELIPDYQLQNAALGVYDEQQTATIRDTVKGFRDEFYRLKGAIEKAKSLKSLKDVTPNFPTQVVRVEPTRAANGTSRRSNS